jgi:hypothetical protein
LSPRVWTVLLSACGVLALAGCGAGASTAVVTGTARSATRTAAVRPSATSAFKPAAHSRTTPPPPSYPRVSPAAVGSSPTTFVPAVTWRGETAAWISRSRAGVALVSFDQRRVEVRLHSGTVDAGGSRWRFGPAVLGTERRRLVAAFNGGFKFSTGAGGFESYGRIPARLRDGLGSIVTYTNGRTDIGAWHSGVPAAGTPVASVRQNLALLINRGRPAASLGCISCWGATLGGVSAPARSALGITADGRLVWAGGEHLTPSGLATALLSAGVVRAVELDINPEWVAGYLYGHRGGLGPLAPVPVVPGQRGVPGFFLAPYSRDFFTVEAR